MDRDLPPSKKNQTPTITTPNLQIIFSQREIEAVTFVNTIIHESIDLSASDILFEPEEHDLRIRARIDGLLYELGKINLETFKPISSRIKVLSDLDPSEKRKIQEGQFTIGHQKRTVNLRIEIAQTVHGELIVIRIHERKTIVMDLTQLGLSPEAYQAYQEMLQQRGGLILVCGPTGCGKTTTLYSTITKLNEGQNYNVMTIEDPVEFHLEGVNQMQVQKKTGFTFTAGLATILRLSSDIILVGEIRDKETAEIVIAAGLSGQLVLSTVHAEDSIGALLRLLDLDIEGYLLSSALLGIVAQRLVRKTCPFCKIAYEPSPDETHLFEELIGRLPKQLMRGKGCPKCQNLTFKGRTGIFEILSVNAKIRSLIRSKVDENTLRQELAKEGLNTLFQDGLRKCEQGLTTVEEVLRTTFSSLER